ncbi:hypothetical protein JQS43_10625 [Natronosporangium hydrolyticum]|uniref:DUF4351 domain-containing protein n=1 Tax=Natronosporangium hydrolyticum TaxID=2811111 RepID=A0A895YFU3_9ACTN|nr:hypothetical protein [Natronosporangium hydrolyticum]QSB16687.1 hypothetical protein JQS43_10625 [Natronosporangium hydrolyticum]
MTTAEMLRAEGEARGRAAMLVDLLTVKFGPIPPPATQAIHAASRDQLRDWAARALTADTIDQVLPTS